MAVPEAWPNPECGSRPASQLSISEAIELSDLAAAGEFTDDPAVHLSEIESHHVPPSPNVRSGLLSCILQPPEVDEQEKHAPKLGGRCDLCALLNDQAQQKTVWRYRLTPFA